MNTRLIISERQLGVLHKYINETTSNVRLKNTIYNFLDKDYEKSGGVKKLGNQFYNIALIRRKIDNEMITPKKLAEYVSAKFSGISFDEIKDSIEGWYYGDYDKDTGMRSKK